MERADHSWLSERRFRGTAQDIPLPIPGQLNPMLSLCAFDSPRYRLSITAWTALYHQRRCFLPNLFDRDGQPLRKP